MANAAQQLAAARETLVEENPFYASLLSRCQISFSETETPSAGVRVTREGEIDLSINPKFFGKLSEKKRVGLLMHEVLHLAMNHLTRGKNLDDKRTANMAMDLSINQFIPTDQLPPGGLLPIQFGLKDGLAFESYYHSLKEMSPKSTKGKGPLDDHSGFENSEGLSEEIKDALIQHAVGEAAKEAEGKKPGSVPQHVQSEIQKNKKSRRIDWKRELRSFIGKRHAHDFTSTRTRPNRRQGWMAMGHKVQPAPKILVGIDESGSISDEILRAFISEIGWMFEAIKDGVEIAHFDTSIAKIEKLKDVRSNLQRYAHGGTDFNCVMEHAKKTRPDLVIMFTDGEASTPSSPGCPTLWVVHGHSNVDQFEGKKIRIQDVDA